MIVKVKVKPNSKKEGIKQVSEDILEVKVSVPPEKGRANQRVIELLSKFYKVPKSKIKIKKGETSRDKLVQIDI